MQMTKVNILTLTVLFLHLTGCQRDVLISPLFGVCARIPVGATYALNSAPPVDFDEGILEMSGTSYSTYIGHNPDFAGERILSNLNAAKFNQVGEWRVGQRTQTLFGVADRPLGALYVMFESEGNGENVLSSLYLERCQKKDTMKKGAKSSAS